MEAEPLDWALKDFSGYIAADELYDGPFCILSIVDNRTFKRIPYQALSRDPKQDDITAFFRRFQAALEQRGLGLRGITTDGSALYPTPIATVFGEIPHQICTFHVLRELTKAVLGAVAKARKGLAARKPKLRRGRPSTKEARRRARQKKRLEQKIGALFEHRYLFVQRRLSPAERRTLLRISRGLPRLRTLRELIEQVYRLFDPIVSGIPVSEGVPLLGHPQARRIEGAGGRLLSFRGRARRLQRRDLGRRARTGLDRSLRSFGTLPRDTITLHLALSFPFPKDRHDLLQRRRSVRHHPHHEEQIFAGTMAHVKIHQRHADHGHVEVQQHTLAVVADQVVEPGVRLQPAEEQLDLPAMPVQEPDDRRVEVEQRRQQIDRILRVVRGDDHHRAQDQIRRSAMVRAHQAAPGDRS